MLLKKNFFIPFAFLLALISCENNRWKADLTAVTVDLNPKRFDLKLTELSGQPFNENEWQQLQAEFPYFADLYVEGVMQFGRAGSPETIHTFGRYLNDDNMIELFNDVVESFPNNSLTQAYDELEEGFKYYKHYFPDRSIPELRTFISAFTYSTVASDSILGVGLDMYMGEDYAIYPKIGIPKYKFKNYNRNYLVSDALKAWLISEFETAGAKNLLEQMIEQGKILYLLSAFLQNTDPHFLLNYTADELEWCKANEAEVWFHFIEMNLLHTTDNYKIRKYLGDAPFIAGFPEGSPGRVGQWVGWQIVEDYMDKNTNTTLEELMKIENADLILQQSNYKPKR